MPKVDAQHLAARRQQIVDAARVCFARDGFDRTSMADIVRESRLSTGAIYSYFAGKEELVAAVASEASTVLLENLTDGALDDMLERIRELSLEHGHARLVAQIWGQASISTELAATVLQTQRDLRDAVAQKIEAHRADGQLPAGPPATDVADAFMALCSGFNLLLALDESIDIAPYARALRAILEQGRPDPT